MQWKNNSTSHSTQPITCAGKCDPTQPNSWIDPTHVHLWSVCQGMTGSSSLQEPYKVVDQMFDYIRTQSSLQALGMASSSVIRDRRESVGSTQVRIPQLYIHGVNNLRKVVTRLRGDRKSN